MWKFENSKMKSMLVQVISNCVGYSISKFPNFRILTFAFLLFLSQVSKAQDHYWSQQYGGQATLTGGTAVVGVNDNSNIYYNPGAVGFIDSARISASTYIYGFEYTNLKNGAGTGLNLKSVRVNILPQLLAGSIAIKKVPKLKLIYGTLTRGRSNVRFTQENENEYEVINGSPNTEYYKARVEFVNNSVEQWAGLGLAYKIDKHWSIGLSAFGVYTHIEVRSTQNVNTDAVFNGAPYTTTVNEYNAMRLNQMTQVFKLGVAAQFKHVHLGMALTLPGIKVWGEGKLEKSFEVYNLNQNAVDTNVQAQKNSSYIISDVQSRLKSNYRIPLSASIGFKLVYPKFSLSAAIEYFMGYKNQTILRGIDRAVVRPTALYGNDTIRGYMNLQTSASYVINGGIGAEIKIRPQINLLMGARTDFTNRTEYLPNNSTINVNTGKSPAWHYIYFSSGFTYKLALHNLTMGLDYGLGIAAGTQQVYNLTEPKQQTYLRGNLHQDVKTSVHKLNFILSYTYFFRAKEKTHSPFSIIEELKKVKKTKKKKPLKSPKL
jgi:hypothetical protein